MPGRHAILSPSSAHRWLKCTACARLEEAVRDSGSVYAEEGTLAHAICEAKLTIGGADELEALRHDPLFTPEMEDHTETYKEIILSKLTEARAATEDAVLDIEEELDLSDYIPEGFGTSDAVIIADNTLEVVDFKYGKGVEVSAINNPQMMIYALGALKVNSFYDINTVKMTIVQPRVGNLSEYVMSVDTLTEWGEKELKEKARIAYSGKAEDGAVFEAGDHCKFCKVKALCKEYAKMATEVVTAIEEKSKVEKKTFTTLLTDEEVAELLHKVPAVKAWCESLEDYALKKALDGGEFPGWKLVEGRSIRKIADPDGLVKAITDLGMDEAILYKPKELNTITTLEKIIGKKDFTRIAAPFIIKPQGKPTLATEDDKRPALGGCDFETD